MMSIGLVRFLAPEFGDGEFDFAARRRRDRTESAFEAQAQREQSPVFTRWCVKLNPNRQARRRESGGEHEAGRARATAR